MLKFTRGIGLVRRNGIAGGWDILVGLKFFVDFNSVFGDIHAF